MHCSVIELKITKGGEKGGGWREKKDGLNDVSPNYGCLDQMCSGVYLSPHSRVSLRPALV